jgi:hypothetical protein
MNHPFNASSNFCHGPGTRRGFMRMGLAGFASLTLPGLLRMRAAQAATGVGAEADHGLEAGWMFAHRHLRSET